MAMENAGCNLAQRLYGSAQVTVLAPRAGNGGGALVSVHDLVSHAVDVTVVVSRQAADFSGVAVHELGILERMAVLVLGAAASHGVGVHRYIDRVELTKRHGVVVNADGGLVRGGLGVVRE